MAKRTVRRFQERDVGVLEAKNDKPHCVFTQDQVYVHDSKGTVLALLQRVSICNDDVIAYDEVLRMERGGSIFLPVSNDGKVGLRKVWRSQSCDPNYRENFPKVDLSQVGQMTYDIFGGYGDPGTTPKQQAITEAEEEGGKEVVTCEFLGKTAMNRAIDTHFTHIFWGTINPDQPSKVAADLLEKNKGNVHFHTKAEVHELVAEGKLYDQCILSALWLFEAKYPGRLI